MREGEKGTNVRILHYSYSLKCFAQLNDIFSDIELYAFELFLVIYLQIIKNNVYFSG